MNRAERRRLKKQEEKEKVTYNLKMSDFNNMMVNAGQRAKNLATSEALAEIDRQILDRDEEYSLDMDAMVLWALYTQLGFSKVRLERFYFGMLEEHLRMRKHYEIHDTYPERLKLKEKCDVDVAALNAEFMKRIEHG